MGAEALGTALGRLRSGVCGRPHHCSSPTTSPLCYYAVAGSSSRSDLAMKWM